MSEKILKIVNHFQGISLAEMEEVALLKRTDTKFILSELQLPTILKIIEENYRVLEIDGKRIMRYNSLYFDTPEHRFYLDHHNGKIKRTKIRMRQYIDSNLYFFEIKKKDGRGNTNKSRIKIAGFEDINSPIYQHFIRETTGINYELKCSLQNNFQRFTLVNTQNKERVTIDINLSYSNKGDVETVDNIAIIELKQARYDSTSPIVQALKACGIQSFGISKYCLGMTRLYDDLKYNAFKPKLLRIKKITA